jgi:hypothetical protein
VNECLHYVESSTEMYLLKSEEIERNLSLWFIFSHNIKIGLK